MKARWVLFALLCAAQVAVPASLVVRHEQTRANGTAWRFQVAPVDPGDPFRGRYVRLSYEVERAPLPVAEGSAGYLAHGRRVYAELERDAQGFARLGPVHERRPAGVEYVDVFVQSMEAPDEAAPGGPARVQVRLPFDRYYLPEAQAPEVERQYAEASRRAQDRTWAEVRVRDGHAALVALVLDGKPVAAPP